MRKLDNANPSEALKIFNNVDRVRLLFTIKERAIIEEALLKAQEQKRVLEIIKKKYVNIFWIRNCKFLEEYNYNIPFYMKLSQKEFNLLKRWFNEKDSYSKN